MRIEHFIKDNIIEIKPYGPLSYHGAVELADFIRNNSKGIRKMIIDLAEVDYSSSAGIRTLMEAELNMSKLDGLELYNVNEAIINVFKMTGLDSIFTIK